jgi:CSLREA domain-containing protein
MNDMQNCRQSSQQEQLKNIVFIDANITDLEKLIPEIVSDTKIVIIDNHSDGIELISRVLETDRYDRVHIISHAEPGCLYLGKSQLSLDTLDLYEAKLKTWFANNNLLIPHPSSLILLYGCNVAAGDAGAEFIAKLQQLTGVEIAASTTLTGNSSLGGNWELDVITSDRDFALAVTEIGQKTYAGVLATFRVNTVEDNSGDNNDLSLREAITAANNNEGTDSIQFAASIADSTISLTEGSLRITDSLSIRGENSITIDGSDSSGVFNIDDGKDFNLLNVSIDGLTITGGNSADSGGGIFNSERLVLSNSSLEDNQADISGGAIDNSGTLSVVNSTINNNQAESGAGLANSGTATITNTTISGNEAFINGGGIDNSLGTLTVNNSTITDNAAESGSGIDNLNGVRATLASTIVAGNEANQDIETNASLVSAGNNLIGNGDSATGFVSSDLVGGRFAPLNPELDSLQNNGGAIATHKLLSGSPAIDAGSNLNELAVDARGEGFRRIVNGLVDIGAFEVQNQNLEGTSGDDNLIGAAAQDLILGFEGNDLLSGNGGNDSIDGDRGHDTLSGGLGADILDGSFGNDLIDGGDGDDLLIGNNGNDSSSGGLGDDSIVSHNGNDTLTGGEGDDFLLGVIGNDTISGGVGNDTLLGGIGNDSVSGGDGDDLLYGGAGRDSLVGDVGADIFAIEFVDSQNIIQDFEDGIDRLAFLSSIVNLDSINIVDGGSGDVAIEDRSGHLLVLVEDIALSDLTANDFVTF